MWTCPLVSSQEPPPPGISFAERSAGYNTFTLSVNTSGIETANNVIIGSCEWNGTNLTSVTPFYFPADDAGGLPTADYDSGYFACSYGNTYSKAHSLASRPRIVVVLHNSASDGSGEDVILITIKNANVVEYGCVGFDGTNVIVQCGADTIAGTTHGMRRNSASGYYRILAWK